MSGYRPVLRRKEKWPTPSAADCFEGCKANEQQAARQLAQARAQYDAMEPGATGIVAVRRQIDDRASDVRHWREMASWWREEAARRAPAAPDTRLPRERGEDV